MRGSSVLALVLGVAACTDGGPRHDPGGVAGRGGGGVIADAGADADADADGGARPDASDADMSAVLIGVTPSPRGDGGGGPTKEDEIEASLTTFAAGVRVSIVSRTWRDLVGADKDSTAAQVTFDHAHGLHVMLDVNVVDRIADGRPAGISALPWDDPASVAAIDAAIDDVLLGVGSELSFVGFGRDVDVYLAAHPGERAAFEALAIHACAYTRTHPAAPMGLQVGVGFSFEGATAPDPSFGPLVAAGDLAVLSYLPGLGTSALRSTALASDLDALIAQAAGRPIALTRVGAPSSAAIGSSPEQQRLFYETLFDALEPRRQAFLLVDAFELHDPAPEACQTRAAEQGEPPSGPFSDYACSLGLFEVGATAKPAWDEVLQGTAKFASP